MGDTVSLTYTGDGTPEWSPQSHLLDKNIHGNTIAYIVDPVTYTLTLTNEFGCTAKDSITFDQIEPCCAFSYPTAFSPNKDGRNDRFRIVTYGNHLYYLLSIYNRYGERIYYGTNPDEGWDGTYNGKDLDLGVYFYYLDAKCVTGYHETKKGEFTLVR
jgi:gliding motility-associated-like protein